MVLTMNVIRVARIKRPLSTDSNVWFPMVREKAIVANPILKACPVNRMVPMLAEAPL